MSNSLLTYRGELYTTTVSQLEDLFKKTFEEKLDFEVPFQIKTEDDVGGPKVLTVIDIEKMREPIPDDKLEEVDEKLGCVAGEYFNPLSATDCMLHTVFGEGYTIENVWPISEGNCYNVDQGGFINNQRRHTTR